MQKNLLFPMLALSSCLALFSCGKDVNWNLGKSDGSTTTIQGQFATSSSGDYFSAQEFSNLCMQARGRISSNGLSCIVPQTVSLPSGTTNSYVTIDSNAFAGKYVVANATNGGTVAITLNGNLLSNVPARTRINQGSGTLSFFVYGLGYSDVSATVWTCYDRIPTATRSLRAVFCDASQIP